MQWWIPDRSRRSRPWELALLFGTSPPADGLFRNWVCFAQSVPGSRLALFVRRARRWNAGGTESWPCRQAVPLGNWLCLARKPKQAAGDLGVWSLTLIPETRSLWKLALFRAMAPHSSPGLCSLASSSLKTPFRIGFVCAADFPLPTAFHFFLLPSHFYLLTFYL